MNALPIRKQIIACLEQLSDEQATKVLSFIETMEAPPYSPESDPMLNGELFFAGSHDLGENAEAILEQEFGLQQPLEDEAE